METCTNFDKIGFRVGYGRQKKVITKEKKAYVFLEDPENRVFISSIEYMSGDESVISNMIILNGKKLFGEIFSP